jgi:hypothetical protein
MMLIRKAVPFRTTIQIQDNTQLSADISHTVSVGSEKKGNHVRIDASATMVKKGSHRTMAPYFKQF